MKNTLLSLLIFGFFVSTAWADSVVLKSGKTIEGKIVHQTDLFIRIIPQGSSSFKEYLMREVAEVKRDQPLQESSLPEFTSGAILKEQVEGLKASQAAVAPKEAPLISEKMQLEIQSTRDELIKEVQAYKQVDAQALISSPAVVQVVAAKTQNLTEQQASSGASGEPVGREEYSTGSGLEMFDHIKPVYDGEVIVLDERKPGESEKKPTGPRKTIKGLPKKSIFENSPIDLRQMSIGVLILFIITLVVVRQMRKKQAKKKEKIPPDTGVEVIKSQAQPGVAGVAKPEGGPKPPPTPEQYASIYEKMAKSAAGMAPTKTTSKPISKNDPNDLKDQNVNDIRYKLNPRTYWMSIFSLFTYPFRKDVFFAWIGATVIACIIQVAMLAPFYGFAISIMMSIYFVGCIVSIVQTAVSPDKEDHFDWPDFTGWMDYFGTAILFILAYLIMFAPAVIYVWKLQRVDWIFFTLIGIGAFISPMYTLAIALVGGLASLNIVNIFKSIFHTFLPYIGTLIVQFFIGILNAVFYITPLAKIPVWGAVITTFIYIYFVFINFRLLGFFYRAHRHKLRWYGEEEQD